MATTSLPVRAAAPRQQRNARLRARAARTRQHEGDGLALHGRGQPVALAPQRVEELGQQPHALCAAAAARGVVSAREAARSAGGRTEPA
jgi:hypothetical protein